MTIDVLFLILRIKESLALNCKEKKNRYRRLREYSVDVALKRPRRDQKDPISSRAGDGGRSATKRRRDDAVFGLSGRMISLLRV